MELTIQEEHSQPVFGRRHLIMNVTFEEAVPSRGAIATQIAESQNVSLDLVSVRRIDPRFGGGSATVEAVVYENKDALVKYEQAHLLERTKKTSATSEPEAEASSDE